MITVTCEQCGKLTKKYPSAVKRNKHVFCSIACDVAWRTGRPRPEHGAKVAKALKGRKPSPQCIEANRKAARKRLLDPAIQAKMQAGVARYYETHPGPNKGNFGARNYNWKGGKSFEPYGAEFNDFLKEQIRERDGHRCQLCDLSQDEHNALYNRRLTIHHIDYDKLNNHPSNLVTLCSNCNAKANGSRKYYTALFTACIAGTDKRRLFPVQSRLKGL